MKRVLLAPAYVLHRRAYRETSFLVELFSQEHGRLTVIARGARKARSAAQGLLQPFVPLLVSWSGKGELMTLSHVEAAGIIQPLRGEVLFTGFYLNELLMALLERFDAHPMIYAQYAKALTKLAEQGLSEPILRSFEKQLLEELGYGLLPKSPVSLHNMFSPERYYRFVPEQGFVPSETGGTGSQASAIFSGKSLLAIAAEDWTADSLQDAKRLIRIVLTPLLGAKQIHSRRLFMMDKTGPVEAVENAS